MDRMVGDGCSSALNGKRVLVTGHTGFKGAWLSLWLHMLGARVVGFALPPERPGDLCNLLELDRIIDHVYGDIRDARALEQVFAEHQPEFVFHLAAQALVRRSYEDPKTTFDTNIGGSVNLLEAVRRTASVRSVIYVTSDKCYKNKEWVWGYRENDELGGRDPYSASKAAAELVFSSYLASFVVSRPGLGIASVRAGNVIGGGDQSPDRIVPDCIRSLRDHCPIILRKPEATRPWQHVLEPLAGYLLLAVRLYQEPRAYSGSWNFGPDAASNHTVRELAERIVSLWGEGSVRVEADSGSAHEAGLLHLNCDKARLLLAWQPQWDFHRTVAEVVSWYKEVDAGRKPLEMTRVQIDAYSRGSHVHQNQLTSV